MTNIAKQDENKQHKTIYVLITLCIFAFGFLLLFNGNECSEAVKGGLSLCFFTVIPSLFPFMCIFDFLRRSGALEAFSSLISKPFCKAFALPESALCAVISGLSCGSPIGMKTASELYGQDKISREECERLICFCGCPSVSFFISGVGIGLYGNVKIGVLLYLSVLFANLFCGLCLSYNKHSIFIANRAKTHICFSSKDFTQSIISSTETIIKLCGFIVFFYVLTSMLSPYLSLFLPDVVSVAILGMFEFVCGVNNSFSSLPFVPSIILCGAIVGWSGFSVHMQSISIFGSKNISFKKYIISKIFICILTAIFAYVSLYLFIL